MVHSYPGDLPKAAADPPGQPLVIGHPRIVGPLTSRDPPPA